MRTSRYPPAVAAGLMMLCGVCVHGQADPPPATQGTAASGSASGAQVAEIKGGFFSSLGQAFKEDFEHEDIRGHFDVGSAPNTHRYYCLFDPKTRKNQPNAISGAPVQRRDGTTGIKGAAVTPLSCADAEQKGLLVTEGYTLRGGAQAAPAAKASAPPAGTAVAPAVAAGAAAATLAAPPATPPAAAPAPVSAPAAAAVPAPPATGGEAAATAASPQREVVAVYERFIAGENAHDRAAVAAVLLDSKDFVWARFGGDSIFGYTQALDAFEREWKGIWRVDPQLKEAQVTTPAAGVAVLVVPLLFTAAAPGQSPSMVPVRWGGVFVKTSAGWRIASIFITPFRDWRAPAG